MAKSAEIKVGIYWVLFIISFCYMSYAFLYSKWLPELAISLPITVVLLIQLAAASDERRALQNSK